MGAVVFPFALQSYNLFLNCANISTKFFQFFLKCTKIKGKERRKVAEVGNSRYFHRPVDISGVSGSVEDVGRVPFVDGGVRFQGVTDRDYIERDQIVGE